MFSDRDIVSQRPKVEAALAGADVFFGSLLFDYDQVSAHSVRVGWGGEECDGRKKRALAGADVFFGSLLCI